MKNTNKKQKKELYFYIPTCDTLDIFEKNTLYQA